MTENELIGKIRKLRQIKPKKDWVLLTKSQILGEETPQFELFPFFKPVYAGLLFLLLLVGLVELSQGALPGNPLYSLKRITEKVQTVFVSQEERPNLNLELANKRIEELNQIAQQNEVKKLAPAIKEVQASVSEVAKNLVTLKKVDKETVEKTKELEKNIEIGEKTLATQISSEETKESFNSFYKNQAEYLISDLEKRTLTEDQMKILEEAKKDFEAGNYSDALEKIFILSQPQ